MGFAGTEEFAESMISFGDICNLSYISILGVIVTAYKRSCEFFRKVIDLPGCFLLPYD